MKLASIPSKITTLWGALAGAGYIRQIPVASQQNNGNGGAASFQDGFPPNTFVQGSGIAPSGQDFNGILQLLSAWAQWSAASGLSQWDSTFAAQVGGINGYPLYACVTSNATPGRVWVSVVDGNTANPDTAGQTSWLPLMLSSDVLALIGANAPKLVTASPTLYVAPPGTSGASDNNPGTQASPLATMAGFYALAATYVVPGGAVKCQFTAPGTYAAASPPQGLVTPVIISGDTTGNNQDAYVISGSGSTFGVFSHTSGNVTYQGVRLNNAANTTSLLGVAYTGQVTLSNVTLAATGTGNTQAAIASSNGGPVTMGTGIHVVSNFGSFISASGGGNVAVQQGGGVSFIGSPAFSTATVVASGSGSDVSLVGAALSGGASGTRYAVSLNASINTGGSGANFIPGTGTGTMATGGQYA